VFGPWIGEDCDEWRSIQSFRVHGEFSGRGVSRVAFPRGEGRADESV
jgi:hypothetical protein